MTVGYGGVKPVEVGWGEGQSTWAGGEMPSGYGVKPAGYGGGG